MVTERGGQGVGLGRISIHLFDELAMEDVIGEVREKNEKKRKEKKRKNELGVREGEEGDIIRISFFFFVHQKSRRRWAVGGVVWASGPLFGCLIGSFILILSLCIFS
jgi:hypothetical protein